jgi:three-Cys-motif partner protein
LASDYRRAFFDGVKEHSEIKLRVFSRYLRPWASKVGSKRDVKRVWIVDGFAGAGTYGDGRRGSPGLALEYAREVNISTHSYKVACFFVEQDPRAHHRLRQLCASYGRDVEVILPKPSSFWDSVPNIAGFVGESPAFVFVDPFGLADLKFKPLISLCNSLPTIDLMVNFMSPAAPRLAPAHGRLITEAVGSEDWSLDTLTQDFVSNLEKHGRFLPPACLPVSQTFGRLKYELVMAAHHPAAYELWNDEIATDDATLLNSADFELVNERIGECVAFLERMLNNRTRFQRDALISQLSVSHCGEFHKRIYLRAVKSMIDSGEWIREPGKIAAAIIPRA